MTKTTTCQICGRPIKANTGLIAHHGYKRPGYGFQTSSCKGARHQPYEVSCDLLKREVPALAVWIAQREAELADFIADPPVKLAYAVNIGGAWNPKYQWREVERPANFDPERPNYISGSYVTVFRSKRHDLQSALRHAQADLKFMQERLTNWTAPQAQEGE